MSLSFFPSFHEKVLSVYLCSKFLSIDHLHNIAFYLHIITMSHKSKAYILFSWLDLLSWQMKNTAWKQHWLFVPLRIGQTKCVITTNRHTCINEFNRKAVIWGRYAADHFLVNQERKEECFQMTVIADRLGNGWFHKILRSSKSAFFSLLWSLSDTST